MQPTLNVDERGFPSVGGRALDLQPKERAVLALLLQRHPAVVSKAEFADQAWSGRLMSDESLARCISRLRRVLAALGRDIESVYGTGYRLAEAGPVLGYSRLIAAAQAAPAVVDAYLRARQLAQRRTPGAMGQAAALLRRLAAQEPAYASARVALAETLAAQVSLGLVPTAAAVDEGLAQLAQAQRLAPGTPGLACARACLLDLGWHFGEAATAHEQALRDGPGDPDTLLAHGRHLLMVGHTAGAVASLRAAVRLLPHSALLRVALSRALAHDGQVQAALAEAQATRDEHPDQPVAASYALALVAYARPTRALLDDAWRFAELPDPPPLALPVLSYALARLGRREEALEVAGAALACAQASAGTAALYVAAFNTLGDTRRAVTLLNAASAQRCGVLPMVLRDPANAALREHAEARVVMRGVFAALAG